jgi:hypothetical protein
MDFIIGITWIITRRRGHKIDHGCWKLHEVAIVRKKGRVVGTIH